jgi:FkbM family methyltransferase
MRSSGVVLSHTFQSHPIFELWEAKEVPCPDAFAVDYPGVLRRREFMSTSFEAEAGSLSVGASVPPVNEEYFEWIDVLESVAAADGGFCMAELGAGYGRWLVRAAVALRRLKPAIKPLLIGVEAEPTHFRWMVEHFQDNELDPSEHRLVEAAVDRSEGEVVFTVGQPSEWYGQAIVPPETTGYQLASVPAVTLSGLLADVERVDLIDLDIQGAELGVLESAIDDLNRRVKRVHIGTHSTELEAYLRKLFRRHGWFKRYDYGLGHKELTPFGEVAFTDGVQTWINPAFETVPPSALELANLEAQVVSLERRLAPRASRRLVEVSNPAPPTAGEPGVHGSRGLKDVTHHPVFTQFPRWSGQVDSGWSVNFLGVRTRDEFTAGMTGAVASESRLVETDYPAFDEEYPEWVDILEAVNGAVGTFTMIELGAGWGRWLMNAAAAARRRQGLSIHLVGVEAEPTHFRWMKQHFSDNSVDAASVTLIEAAVAAEPGRVRFHIGEASAWYGQAIDVSQPQPEPRRPLLKRLQALFEGAPHVNERSIIEVRAVTLSSILQGLARVDLVDLDVQGVEAEVLESAEVELAQKVKRVHVGTHDADNERRLRELFERLGWDNLNDYACGSVDETPWGRISFQDGVQTWVNVALEQELRVRST